MGIRTSNYGNDHGYYPWILIVETEGNQLTKRLSTGYSYSWSEESYQFNFIFPLRSKKIDFRHAEN